MPEGTRTRTRPADAPNTHVALLRGINVGGKNKLSMKDLVTIFSGAGCSYVRTYIQSGNVVFQAPTKATLDLPEVVSAKIAERFGYRVPLVLRTAEELRDIAHDNPWLSSGAAVEQLYVAFLAEAPSEARIATLDPNRSPPDEFVVRGKEIYLWFPEGVARSKLTNDYFDSKLGTISTVRNWRTVLKLHELTDVAHQNDSSTL